MSIRWLPIISGNGFGNLVNFINVFGMGYILNCNDFWYSTFFVGIQCAAIYTWNSLIRDKHVTPSYLCDLITQLCVG